MFLFASFLAASLLSAMDTTADPCENFFQYACGTWNKKHIIPEDRSSISTFEVSMLDVICKYVPSTILYEQFVQTSPKMKMIVQTRHNGNVRISVHVGP